MTSKATAPDGALAATEKPLSEQMHDLWTEAQRYAYDEMGKFWCDELAKLINKAIALEAFARQKDELVAKVEALPVRRVKLACKENVNAEWVVKEFEYVNKADVLAAPAAKKGETA